MNLVQIVKNKTLSLSQVFSNCSSLVSIKQGKCKNLRGNPGVFIRGNIP